MQKFLWADSASLGPPKSGGGDTTWSSLCHLWGPFFPTSGLSVASSDKKEKKGEGAHAKKTQSVKKTLFNSAGNLVQSSSIFATHSWWCTRMLGYSYWQLTRCKNWESTAPSCLCTFLLPSACVACACQHKQSTCTRLCMPPNKEWTHRGPYWSLSDWGFLACAPSPFFSFLSLLTYSVISDFCSRKWSWQH